MFNETFPSDSEEDNVTELSNFPKEASEVDVKG